MSRPDAPACAAAYAAAPITRTHVHSLPAELLLAVFSLLVASSRKRGQRQRRPQWVRVTLVCCRWRAIAFTARKLWTSVWAGDLNLVQAFVQRARGAPIDLVLVPRDSKRSEATMMAIGGLLSNNHVAASIRSMFLCAESLCSAAVSALPSTFLGLEALIVEGPDCPGDIEGDFSDALRILLVDKTHTLRTLELARIPLWSYLTIRLTHLTSLRCTACPLDGETLLTALAGLSRLQELYIAEYPSIPTAVNVLVSLPHLHTLTLVHELATPASILSHLALSTSTSVLIRYNWRTPGQQIPHFFEAIPRDLEAYRASIKHVKVEHAPVTEINEDSFHHIMICGRSEPGSTGGSLQIVAYISGAVLFDTDVESLTVILPSEHTTNLEFVNPRDCGWGDVNWDEEDVHVWRLVLALYPQVKSMHFRMRSYALEALFEALGSRDEDGAVPCPELEYVHLEALRLAGRPECVFCAGTASAGLDGKNFSDEGSAEDEDDADFDDEEDGCYAPFSDPDSCALTIHRTLRRRAKAGASCLKVLCIEPRSVCPMRCDTLDLWQLTKIRGHVEELMYNGKRVRRWKGDRR